MASIKLLKREAGKSPPFSPTRVFTAIAEDKKNSLWGKLTSLHPLKRLKSSIMAIITSISIYFDIDTKAC
jgi:hypothetical protein